MKNLLFLAGLIMVTASCSSGSSGSSSVTSENDKNANISFVYLGVSGKMYNALLYDLCQTEYNKENHSLCLNLEGDKPAKRVYPLSVIKDEYIDEVKKNKISAVYKRGEFYPVVVEKDSNNQFQSAWDPEDMRQFSYECVLKDVELSGQIGYNFIYHGAFLLGFTKVGNQIIQDGQFFFADDDFAPEKTPKGAFGERGTFSAGLSIFSPPVSNDFFAEDRYGQYRYALVQLVCEDNNLIIRVDDGSTFRYPLSYLQPWQVSVLQNGRQPLSTPANHVLTAVQIPNGNWIPAGITLIPGSDKYRYVYYLWHSDQHYPIIFERFYKLSTYLDFMEYYGVDDFLGFDLQHVAFYNEAAN